MQVFEPLGWLLKFNGGLRKRGIMFTYDGHIQDPHLSALRLVCEGLLADYNFEDAEIIVSFGADF